ncbi:unnamed protein product [Amoebophrya sp. A25]|nr:unnamed protein product [Amoebophrya sp. A25]|eukprot:GSA25T00012847001.1
MAPATPCEGAQKPIGSDSRSSGSDFFLPTRTTEAAPSTSTLLFLLTDDPLELGLAGSRASGSAVFDKMEAPAVVTVQEDLVPHQSAPLTATTSTSSSPSTSSSGEFIPRRVLFTGGCGFIGSNVLRYLVHTYPRTKFVNLDKLDYCGNPKNIADVAEDCANYWFVHGDICDRDLVRNLFEQHRFDCVFHFAALSHVDRSFTNSDEFVRTNVNGTHVLHPRALHPCLNRRSLRRLELR